MEIGAIRASVEWMPLLHKQVEVSSITMEEPVIEIVRNSDGQMNLAGIALPAAAAAAGSERVDHAASSAMPFPVAVRVSRIRVQNGRVHWLDRSARPPIDLWAEQVNAVVSDLSPGAPFGLEVTAALVSSTPNIRFKGTIQLPDATGPGSISALEADIERLSIAKIVPAPAQGEPALRGTLDISFRGQVASLDPQAIQTAVTGRSTLELTDGVLENVNVLRLLFDQLSMLPGLVQRLQEKLDSEYQRKLAESDTRLLPVTLAFSVQGQQLQFQDMRLGSEEFAFSGSGRIDLQGTAEAQGMISVAKPLSDAIIRSVSELQNLTDGQGRIEFPITVHWPAQTPVVPDMHYIGQRVIVTKAAELLGDFIRKELGGDSEQPNASGQQPAGSSDSTGSNASVPLGQFLQKILQDKASSGTPSKQ